MIPSIGRSNTSPTTLAMERTPRLVRLIVDSLPPPPDATIVDEDESGGLGGRAEPQVDRAGADAVEQEASIHAAPESVGAMDERGSAAGGLQGGAWRQAIYANPEDQESAAGRGEEGLGVLAASPGRHAARGVQESARRQAICAEPEDQEAAGRAAPDIAGGVGDQDVFCAAMEGPLHRRYDPYTDIYLYGRPSSEVLELAWMRLPLVLHDKDLLAVREYIATSRKNRNFALDLTLEISSVLENHPGPFAYFRIDSCVWSGAALQMGQWLQVLSAKGIRELIIVNKSLSTDMPFPINVLQSSELSFLCLAFMEIPGLRLNGFNYSSLSVLHITGCIYSGKGLCSVVSDCTALHTLMIGSSDQDLVVISQSLKVIQMWRCTASFLTVDYAPKLLVLGIGIQPKPGVGAVAICLNRSEALADLNYLMLPFHDLEIGCSSVLEGVVCLANVTRLRIGLQMESGHQRCGLVRVLRRLPKLTHLCIWILEDDVTADAFDGTVSSGIASLSCIRLRLQTLLIEDFRGGKAEVAVVAAILSIGQNLTEVILDPYVFSAEAVEAATELDQGPRASSQCTVRFALGD